MVALKGLGSTEELVLEECVQVSWLQGYEMAGELTLAPTDGGTGWLIGTSAGELSDGAGRGEQAGREPQLPPRTRSKCIIPVLYLTLAPFGNCHPEQ